MRKQTLIKVVLLIVTVLLLFVIQDNFYIFSKTVYEKPTTKEYATQDGIYNFNLSKIRTIGGESPMDDPEHDWKRAIQIIAKDLKDSIEYDCINKTWRGNWLDCNSFPFVVRPPCLVYSFGINYDFGPDDAFATLGCEVFSFDPSMGNTKEHIRKSGAHFLPLGIAGKSDKITPRLDEYTRKNPKQKWEIKTLNDIMISLGHKDRHLDFLKMDIEHYEWDTIKTILEDDLSRKIKQLALEFHIFPDTPKADIVKYIETFNHFKTVGFSRYYGRVFEYDLNEKRRRMQADAAFVNLKFDFKQD